MRIIKKAFQNKKAFTIIELLVIIFIIGILASIVIVSYTGWREKSYDASVVSDANSIHAAEKLYILSTNSSGKAWDSTSGLDPDLKVSIASDSKATVTLFGVGYCIKVYNPNSKTYSSLALAYQIESANGICDLPTFVASISPFYPYGSVSTADGGFAVVGNYTGSLIAIIKYDSLGKVAWFKTLSSTGIAKSVAQTSDLGFVVTGYTGSLLFIAKFDSNGNLSWAKTANGATQTRGNAIIQTSDGGYAVAGDYYDSTVARSLSLLSKFDSTGTLSWTKTYQSTSIVNNYALAIAQKSDGSFVITGEDDVGAYVSSISSTGTVNWTKVWTESSSYMAEGNSVVVNSDGSLNIAGSYWISGLDCDGSYEFLQKFDATGNILWTKATGGASTTRNMILNSDGSYVTSGTISYCYNNYSKTYLNKYDSSGNVVWSKYFGDEINYYINYGGVSAATDGGYHYSVFDSTNSRSLVIKLNSTGDIKSCSGYQTCWSTGWTTFTPTGSVATSSFDLVATARTLTVVSLTPTVNSLAPSVTYLYNY
jgi:type II secretory pathway pseudopilin PulG